MGPWCTGVAGRAGDHTIRGASKGVRPQGLLEGSMAGKLELPLSSANPPHPPRPAVTRTRSGRVSSPSSQHRAPEGLSPSWSHQSRPKSLPGVVEPI